MKYLILNFAFLICSLSAFSDINSELDRIERNYVMASIGSKELSGKDLSFVNSYQKMMRRFSHQNKRYSSYSPALFSLTGVFHSASFKRKHRFNKIRLEMPEKYAHQQHYQKDVKIYYQKPNKNESDPRMFVLLQGSFSNFKDGRQINQTIHYLNEIYNRPAIIVLDGFATKETYRSKPKFPILNGKYYGRDIYLRLRDYIENLSFYEAGKTKAGIIGYSGGASFLLSILKEDERKSGKGQEIFNQGGLSLSPVIRLEEIENNLDGYWENLENQGIKTHQTLTGFYISKALGNLSGYLTDKQSILPSSTDFFDLLTDKTHSNEFYNWEKRFFNEFRFKNLVNIAKAFKQKKNLTNYKEYFAYSFSEHKKSPEYIGQDFEEYTSILGVMPKKLPVYMVFTLDDPVLQNANFHKDQYISTEMRSVLNEISSRDNVRLFTPNWGGHLGYLMDDNYIKDLLKVYFKK